MEVNKEKLLFFCSKLEGGGAEKHLVRILNEADTERFDIHLALSRGGGSYEKELKPFIKTYHLTQASSSTLSLLQSYRPLRRLVKTLKPSVVVSIMDRQNVLVSLLKGQVKNFPPTVICCQNAIRKSLEDSGIVGRMILSRISRLYNQNNAGIALSQGVKDEMVKDFGIKIPIDVIYNAGIDDRIEELASEKSDLIEGPPLLLACGRLTKQKGFDILIEAIHLLDKRFDYRLIILGEGEERKVLEGLVNQYQLGDRVSFLGFKNNPYPYFSQADIFILSSRWEGFGNVVTEAMYNRCAVISTDCPYGPNEIIENGKNGLLVEVENPFALKEALEKLLSDPELKNILVANGVKRSKDFMANVISEKYFKSIEDSYQSVNS